jgi:serine/threonine protein kinase
LVLQYAEGRNLNYWINHNSNLKNFNWLIKLKVLENIISDLKEIHQKQMIHCNLHTGNILVKGVYWVFSHNNITISDVGLYGDAGNIDDTKIYGVMPYVAPEVLRGKLHTQESDVYSFGMIMYFIATGRQPFANRAHDQNLALDICKNIRPETNVPEIPVCYIELMKKCWDSDPKRRPNVTEIEELIRLYYNSYEAKQEDEEIDKEIEEQFTEAEKYRRSNIKYIQSSIHHQAIYMSRLLNFHVKDLNKHF